MTDTYKCIMKYRIVKIAGSGKYKIAKNAEINQQFYVRFTDYFRKLICIQSQWEWNYNTMKLCRFLGNEKNYFLFLPNLLRKLYPI